ncbi:helix-turn-helix domain-containing protein [Halosegnis marinus]|uniref:Helix-turn-helix domain-containing protein n=1 Tax=Halosegnis marinus TaxID=3034023 RepID=A0ABD5ZMN7_9EURY|nr:helix-turn-helix domain-containing protein [Halosegnis sp. DT85]
MPQARLRVTLPDGLWIGRLSRAHPDAVFRVLTAFADGERGVALVELSSPDPAPLLADLVDEPAVTATEVLHREGDRVLVRLGTSNPLLLAPVRESGVPLDFPFRLADGHAVWEVRAPHDRLSALGDGLRDSGIRFEVERVGRVADPDGPLAEGQRRVLEAAVDHGYYDTPRECTLTELADRLDMAKSTVSETLHRAEEQIVKEFVGEPTDGP